MDCHHTEHARRPEGRVGRFFIDKYDSIGSWELCSCEHLNVVPHRKWDSGSWYWTCSDCYEAVSNQFITDRMREKEERRKDRRAEDMLSRDIVDRNLR